MINEFVRVISRDCDSFYFVIFSFLNEKMIKTFILFESKFVVFFSYPKHIILFHPVVFIIQNKDYIIKYTFSYTKIVFI